MKTIYLILLAVLSLNTAFGQKILNNLHLDKPISGNQSYSAYKEIKLLPGFSFKANNSSLTAQIVPYQLPKAIAIEGPNLCCPSDIPLYKVTSGDGRLEGGLPDDLVIFWSSPNFMLHPVNAIPINCLASPMLGGINNAIAVTVHRGKESVVTVRNDIRIVTPLPIFHVNMSGSSFYTTLTLGDDVKCGIESYNWEVAGHTGTGHTFNLPKLPVGRHTVKCTVKTICGNEKTETIFVNVELNCGQYCPLEVKKSSFLGTTTLTASLPTDCDLVIKKVRWRIFNYCDYSTTNQEGLSIQLNSEDYLVDCTAEIEGCSDKSQSRITVSGTCPRSDKQLLTEEPVHHSYPNPASHTLNVDINYRQVLGEQLTDARTLKKEANYDIRLYDWQASMLKRTTSKGESVELNIGKLPNGIYYLHIYDGVSEKPEMHQIVIEH